MYKVRARGRNVNTLSVPVLHFLITRLTHARGLKTIHLVPDNNDILSPLVTLISVEVIFVYYDQAPISLTGNGKFVLL